MPEYILQILRFRRIQTLLLILPFFLLGVTFWMVGGILTRKILSSPYSTLDKLQADTQLYVYLKLNLAVNIIDIEQDVGLLKVETQVANPVLKRIEFQIPNIPSNLQEVVLLQQLDLFAKEGKSKNNKVIMMDIPINVQIIKAEIHKERGVSFVKVMTASDLLTKLEFEFPITEVNMIEAMIAQELGLSRRDISHLVRYQIK
ncbi:hypothetical protein WA1_06885 [Scytonema hofmannii PCC 7110]|uniref:Uncharacterized protein n=1 Tax=Scytonema hofmannii PCC 7110 TaxID=128403 RepID=A0A139WSY0_9CYAN|nr:hypothetical protein [Scytonema hofmannii]KYC35542.1 hypothetical protein WA1_06885 [Scytonema hofmannii PCC 7110]